MNASTPNRRMKVVVVGLGQMGRSHALAYHNNPEFEKILDQARGETDEAKRNALYKQADKILYDDAPWLFVVYDQSPKAFRKDRLQNFNLAASNFFSLVNVSLK